MTAHRITMFLGLLFGLTACQSTADFSAAVDTLRAAGERPQPINLAKPELDAFPFASQYLEIDQFPRILVVHTLVQSGRDVYVTADKKQLMLADVRLVATAGFDTDAELLSDVPSPASALQRKRPQCWQGLWRATGNQPASNYLLKGCLQLVGQQALPMPALPHLNPEPTYRVDERVEALNGRIEYTNSWWLNANGRVLASVQQAGPLMPVMRFQTVKFAASQRQVNKVMPLAEGPIQVSVSGLEQNSYAVNGQLSELLNPYLHRSDIDWSASVLYDLSDDVIQPLQQTQQLAIQHTKALIQQWQRKGQRGMQLSAMRVLSQLESYVPARRVPISLDPVALFIDPTLDRQLKGTKYQLVLRKAPVPVPVAGVLHPMTLRPQQGQTFNDMRLSLRALSGANVSAAVLLDAKGQQYRVNLNQPTPLLQELPPGASLILGFRPSLLPVAQRELNDQLVTLAWNRLP